MSLFDPTVGWLEVAVESTYGTPPGDPFILMPTEPPDISEDLQMLEREAVKPTEGTLQTSKVKDRTTISGTVRVAPNPSTDSSVPSISPLLVAAGLQESTSQPAAGETQAQYIQSPSQQGSATIHWYHLDQDTGQWLELELSGYRGTISLNIELDSYVTLDFEGEGLYAEMTAGNSPSVPSTFNQGQSVLEAYNCTFSYASADTRISQAEFALNRDVHAVETVTANPKVDEIFTRQGDAPGGSFDPVATEAGFSAGGVVEEARDSNANALQLDVVDGSKELQIGAPAAQLEMPSLEVDDAFQRFSTPYMCRESSPGAGDQVEIKFLRTDS